MKSFTPVLAIIGLVGLGVGGYNMLSTGCPLGTCDKAETAVVTPAAATTEVAVEKQACPLSCSGEKAEADVKTVALTAEKAEGATCAEKAACDTATACTESSSCCQGKEAGDCCKSKNGGTCPGTAEACGTGATATTASKGECPYSSAPATDGGTN